LIAMGITFIAFEGYEIIVQAGEEVKEPSKTIPRAIFKSLIIVIPIYALVAFTAIGAVDPEGGQPTWQFLGEAKELGLAEAAARFMPAGTIIILVGGLLSTISALNATTYSSTRVSFAMGRDGTLPSIFEKVHDRFKTPYIALAATGVLIIIMVITVPIEDVAAAADVMFLLLFLQVNYAVIKIRGEMGDRIDYGYRMPWFPAIPIIGIASNTGLAIYLFFYSALGWAAAAGWIGIGVLIFYTYARGRTEEDTTPQVTFERKEGARAEETILAPVANPEHVDTVVGVALALARQRSAEVVVLNVIRVPPQVPMDEGRRRTAEAQPVVDRVEELRERIEDVPISMVVGVGRRVSAVIDEIAERENSSTVVIGWHGHAHEGRIRGSVAQEVLLGAERDVVLVRDRGLPDDVERITAAVSPGIRGPDTTATAVTLAAGFDADLRLLNVVETGSGRAEEMEEWLEELREDLLDPEGEGSVEGRRLRRGRIDTEIIESTDFVSAVGDATGDPELLVVGTSRDWRRRDNLGGGVIDDLTNRVQVTTAVIRPYEPTPLTWWRRIVGLLSGRRAGRSRLQQ
ncbi:MAG: amino acid permease, partial [Nitriliruptorales bacterium]|nr:amino acid permease [Nitriliruptorales bacterium]